MSSEESLFVDYDKILDCEEDRWKETNGPRDFVGLRCCYTSKSQEMLGVPPLKIAPENSTHCSCLEATCRLANIDRIYPRRVGMSPLCVDRMCTALGKLTAGNERSASFHSLFFRSSWPTCGLLHSWVSRTSLVGKVCLLSFCSPSDVSVTQICILCLCWLSWIFQALVPVLVLVWRLNQGHVVSLPNQSLWNSRPTCRVSRFFLNTKI